jgi:glycosyltransferase involved in cell wall biosynthesis
MYNKNNNLNDSDDNSTPSPQDTNPQKDTNSQNTDNSSGENRNVRKHHRGRHRYHRNRRPKTDKEQNAQDGTAEKLSETPKEKIQVKTDKPLEKPEKLKEDNQKGKREPRTQGQRHRYQKPQQHNQRSSAPEKLVNSNQMVSVVIPTLDEEESLGELTGKLARTFEEMGCSYEVIFVDDGSTDNSFKKIKELRSRNNKIHCIKFRRNYGKSAALAAGFKRAKGDIVITMDADLQDDPAEIPELIKVLNSGYDLVSGWKKVRYDPFIKKHTSKLFNYVTSKIAGVRLHDFNCGLKAYRKEVVKSVKVYGEMHRYIPALAHLSGFRVTEKPVKHHARKFGVTKFGASRFLNGFLDLLTVVFTTKFITKPLHLFGALGMASFFAGFITILYLTYLKYFEGKPVSDRPLFLIGILFVIVGVQFITLGLIAEMITKSRPREEDSLIEASF